MNPWKILGVHRQSSEEEIKLAFHSIAARTHPDTIRRHTDYSVKVIDKFVKANEAYQILKDKKRTSEFIKQISVFNALCPKCTGKGATFKTIGMTRKVFTGCPKCGGAGVLINEEQEDVIELQSPNGAGGKKRDTRRTARASERSKH